MPVSVVVLGQRGYRSWRQMCCGVEHLIFIPRTSIFFRRLFGKWPEEGRCGATETRDSGSEEVGSGSQWSPRNPRTTRTIRRNRWTSFLSRNQIQRLERLGGTDGPFSSPRGSYTSYTSGKVGFQVWVGLGTGQRVLGVHVSYVSRSICGLDSPRTDSDSIWTDPTDEEKTSE